MQDNLLKPRYYSVTQIKQMENCGRDYAYKLAKKLPHEKRGKGIYVYAEDYEEYYKTNKENAIASIRETREVKCAKVYQIRKIN